MLVTVHSFSEKKKKTLGNSSDEASVLATVQDKMEPRRGYFWEVGTNRMGKKETRENQEKEGKRREKK